jgi:hypothetical protein
MPLSATILDFQHSLELKDEPSPVDFPLLPAIEEIALKPSNSSGALFLIEVNGVIKSTAEQPKPAGVNSGAKNPNHGANGSYWLTCQFTLSTIHALILHGFILRFGVKNGGTSYKNHFVSSHFFFLDFDSNQSTQESITQFGSQAFLIYKTASYTPANQKHRVVFRLSTPVTDPYQLRGIIQVFLTKNPKADQSCLDPSRISYPCAQHDPEPVLLFNQENTVNTDAVLESHQFSVLVDLQSSNYTEGRKTPAPTLLNTFVKQHLAALEWDLNAFLTQLQSHFRLPLDSINFQPTSPDSTGDYKWHSPNPWSSTNASGTSLVASFTNSSLLFYDRSSGSQGTNLPGFLHALETGLTSLDCVVEDDDYASIWERIQLVFPSSYRKKSDLQYLDCKTGSLKDKDIQLILDEYIYPALHSKFFVCSNYLTGNQAHGFLFYYYVPTLGWRLSAEFNSLRIKIQDVFFSLWGYPMESRRSNALTDRVLLNHPDYLKLDKQPSVNINYQFFSNGMFNLRTRQLEEYRSDVWHFKRLSYPYNPPTGIAASLFLQGLKEAGVTRDDILLLFRVLILTAQNQFYKANVMIYLFGRTSTGKSTVAKTIARMFDVKEVNADDAIRTPDYLGTHFSPGATVFDEVTTLAPIMTQLMTIIRSTTPGGVSFRYRNLYVAGRNETFPTTFFLTGEHLTFGSNKAGLEGQSRRLLSIEFKNKMTERGNIWQQFHENEELYRDLFSWAINHRYEAIPLRLTAIRELLSGDITPLQDDDEEPTRKSSQQKRAEELLTASDPMYEFLQHFVPDPNGEFSYTNRDLVALYVSVTGDDKSYVYINQFTRFMQLFSNRIRDRIPEFTKKKVRLKPDEKTNQSSYRFFGIRFVEGDY